MEKRTGQKVEIIGTDNGREFTNKEFNEGIARQFSVPYNPSPPTK